MEKPAGTAMWLGFANPTVRIRTNSGNILAINEKAGT